MSDRMTPMSASALFNWARREWEQRDAVFGVYDVYVAKRGAPVSVFGEKPEIPAGPAAGPHTQLAQNIVAAYAAGARYFELKTVQEIDGEDLPVQKPCILAADECYNVEWSTELRVEQALGEYIKAYFALKLLSRYYGFGAEDGFVFNMSVGYDMKGITGEKVDRFIEGMKRADTALAWRECISAAKRVFPELESYIDGLSPEICHSVTLSTLHGCPPDEIERIARYLIEVKRLNTLVKCNPTLLGYEYARSALNALGYGYMAFGDGHFKSDLQFKDAIPMFRRLKVTAAAHGVEFGVKLSNTMPVDIERGELPGNEMYMSGRSLFPLTVELAHRIAREFGGDLRISFSGGADAFNIAELYACGVYPITFATTLLKPGGYNRCKQIAQLLEAQEPPAAVIDAERLGSVARGAREGLRYRKGSGPRAARKPTGRVPQVNCFTAACTSGCPISQEIPEYMALYGKGMYAEALHTIMRRNPLPNITGTICTHKCMAACARNYYDSPVQIRAAKLHAAELGHIEVLQSLRARVRDDIPAVAIVGGGPAGMAAAHFLAREGRRVVIFEREDALGGTVRHIIPEFRIAEDAIERDAQYLERLGVEVRLNTPAPSIDELKREGFGSVIVAIGAQKPVSVGIDGAMDALEYLKRRRAGERGLLSGNVVVIGAGNTAMDTARAAIRTEGVTGVTIAYRRTAEYMPADREELELALAEGVTLREMLEPKRYENGVLLCSITAPDGFDGQGRMRFTGTNREEALPADYVIVAAGSRVDSAYLEQNSICGGEGILTGDPAVYVVGDACRGAATVVEAIADAADAAEHITGGLHMRQISFKSQVGYHKLLARRGRLCAPLTGIDESERCLQCSTVCEACADACPNRANVAISVPGMEQRQIIHIDDLCNECGNCAAFCPHGAKPYADKLTYFSDVKAMKASANEGFALIDAKAKRVYVRTEGFEGETTVAQDKLPTDIGRIINAFIEKYQYMYS
ncbi:MAG: putative selenate reductase subunit YgfK [Clostridia bacterium]|nr:putative selenate reductase subunit YgfK [Clostridia bacterium]